MLTIPYHLIQLWDILDSDGEVVEATQRQKDYLIRLGFEDDLDEISKHDASSWIKKLKGKILEAGRSCVHEDYRDGKIIRLAGYFSDEWYNKEVALFLVSQDQ